MQVHGDLMVQGNVIDSSGRNGIVLYENSSGTNGTITLGDSAANYDYMDIYYKKDGCGCNSTRVDSPNGKDVNLMLNQLTSGAGTFQNLTKRIYVSGTSITVTTDKTGFCNINHGGTGNLQLENHIYITKVVGYNQENYQSGNRREY